MGWLMWEWLSKRNKGQGRELLLAKWKPFLAAPSLQNRCQNQIPDDAKGQDQLNLSNSNWICPNVVEANCKEINQGSAPFAPSRHHICFQRLFKFQKPYTDCCRSTWISLTLWICLFGVWSVKDVELAFWLVRIPPMNSLLWCIAGSLMHRWGKKAASRAVGKTHQVNLCSLNNKDIWGYGYAPIFFVCEVFSTLQVQTVKNTKKFRKFTSAGSYWCLHWPF